MITILVVDDLIENQMMIKLGLRKLDYNLVMANSGSMALEILENLTPDMILMDIQMPGLDGFETTDKIKENPRLKEIPVLFLSALKDINNIVKCYDSGGVDYISKPFRIPELIARISTHLKIRQLQSQLESEYSKMNALLHNMLPHDYILNLREGKRPQTAIHKDVVVIFSDFKNFTGISKEIGAKASIDHLNFLFFAFDEIAEHYSLERVKTIGDGYFAISGINSNQTDLPLKSLAAMIKMQEFVQFYNEMNPEIDWKLRIGAHIGDVIAGIVGNQKIAFDIWGHTVNVASRLQSVANTTDVMISTELFEIIKDDVICISKDMKHLHHLGDNWVYSVGKKPNKDSNINVLLDQLPVIDLYNKYNSDSDLLYRIF